MRYLVGGFKHELYLSISYMGMSSSQLTFMFFRGIETTNQILFFGRSNIVMLMHIYLGLFLFLEDITNIAGANYPRSFGKIVSSMRRRSHVHGE